MHLGSGMVLALLLCSVLDILMCFSQKLWTRPGYATALEMSWNVMEVAMPLFAGDIAK